MATTTPFREIWFTDFEFQALDGERPWPVCMVARELRSGRVIRLWRNDLLSLHQAPFDTGPESVLVAYFASAELGCFLELGWSLPANVLDLFVEHRVDTNGHRLLTDNSLLGALALRGLSRIEVAEKDSMRKLVCDQSDWSSEERMDILSYCESDVSALEALFKAVEGRIDWPRALYRGRYMAAVARMERTGIPIDTILHRAFVHGWDGVRERLVATVDRDYGVYDGLTFKSSRFNRWLRQNEIPWPRRPSGALRLDDDTFKSQEKLWPIVSPLRELRQSLHRLHLADLKIGSDKRSRTLLSPFRSVTGRNQPSAKQFAFGPSRWQRGVIKPPDGYGIAYIDYASQEICIAAGLSGDERLIEAYLDGDPYIAFAKQAKLVPPDATSTSHKVVRDRCKEVVLGLNYGIGAETMAMKSGMSPAEARELIYHHKRTYRDFWRWSDATVEEAFFTNEIRSVFGWKRRIRSTDKPTSLMNFPMQANGAEMMRIAAIAATEAGIEVCAPVHDAFLIIAPLDRLDDDVGLMRELMAQAGIAVTGGVPIRTDAKVVKYPDRYMDPRGSIMWNRVVHLLNMPEARV